jgi:hypothetical protein
MPSSDSQSGQVVTILKRSVGALMALIGGLGTGIAAKEHKEREKERRCRAR